ncbi:LPS export ABC transporter periplasmic protein LptC [Hymenobacter gummosus]|uniref:LPS export ABC transporter periplasmic protein LptC n=1 Tax=Hymenobacter gummosus TaxID=1776032 RepID=A0A3S0HLX9_9BACT|nr:LPS export ABC transporter periplasmic protein LptC [Hymenobacter gummosus]RTQ48391.1 LPS export ABC transporter periplasmic protein LptC [Hymenobacter gummosus]
MKHCAGLGLLAAALLSGCRPKEEAPVKQVNYKGPTLETTDVLTLFSDSARLQVRLKAPLEQTYENGDLIYPKGVDMIFYAKDGHVVNTLRGNYGKYTRADSRYVIRGDVRVLNEEKQQSLRTEELFYDKPKQRIYNDTTTFVRVTTPYDTLRGYGLETNESFSPYRILRPVGSFAAEQPADKK